MRIDAEVLGGSHIAGCIALGGLILYGVHLGVAMTQVERLLAILGCQAGGVFELMPSPVGHGCQRHTCLIVKRERLEASNVDRRCKVAVADRE